jgi:hypothetical protein
MENTSALMRRWNLLQSGALDDPRVVNRWFPGQRDILEILQVLTLPEVERIADCGVPLFGLQLRCTDFVLDAYAARQVTDPMEQGAVQESFIALMARLDCVRTCFQQACLTFNLTYAEAAWLQRFCAHELQALAHDPSLQLTPLVSTEFFVASATRTFTSVQRSVLGCVSRRARPALAH